MSTARKTGAPKSLATTAAKPASKTSKKPVEKVEVKKKEKKQPTKKVIETKSNIIKSNIYVQYLGQEISYEEIVQKVKSVWTLEGNKLNLIKTLDVYVKPEDASIYYVINEEITGSISI